MKPKPDFPATSPSPYAQHPANAPFQKTSVLAIISLILGITSLVPTCIGPLAGVILGIVALVQINGSHGQYKGTGLAATGIGLSLVLGLIVPILVLLPAVQTMRAAARKTVDSNSIRQICISSHNYNDTYRQLPPTNGQQQQTGNGLSWRVHLLPFIDEQQLYDQFRMDEPWDSPHNLSLLPLMPRCYQSVSIQTPLEEGYTLFQRPMGEFAFDLGNGRRRKLQSILDGTSNTIMIVLVDPSESVPWTKPDDYHFDPNDPRRGLAVNARGEHLVGLADGSVRTIPQQVNDKTVAALMTADGGEVIDIRLGY